MIEQLREPFREIAGLEVSEVFHFLEREQSVSGLDDAFAQTELILRLPGQAGFNRFQDRRERGRDVALEEIPDEHRMHDGLARGRRGGALFGR